ncbi:hypothetical protein ACFL6S_31570, partial [Candidatus Poribacteria bacterium]
HVYLLDNSGNELWKYKCKASGGSITGPPVVDFVKIDDLEGYGQKEIIVGANWIHVLNADGEVKWEHYMEFRRGSIVGDFTCGAVADVDGDGRKEVLGSFITSYPKIQALDAKGKLHENLLNARLGLNIDVPIDMAVISLPGVGQPKYIVSLDNSKIGIFLHDQKPREEAGGMNRKRFVKMAIYQPDAEKPPTIAAGTSTCDLFRVSAKPEGQPRHISVGAEWLANLGEKITALLIEDMDSDGHPELYAGTKNGSIYAFDLEKGTEIGHKKVFDAPVSATIRAGKDLLIAGHGVWNISER